MSSSARVVASRTTSLMHGGGVMGRLSCKLPTMSQPECPQCQVSSHRLPCLRIRTFEPVWVAESRRGYTGCSGSKILPYVVRKPTCISSPLLLCLSTAVLEGTWVSWVAPPLQTMPTRAGTAGFCGRRLAESPW